MPLTDLSIDIWCNIIVSGGLQITDLVHLLRTNVSLKRYLDVDLIWSSLGNNLLSTLSEYELGPQFSESDSTISVKSCIVKDLLKKESELLRMLNKYEPRGEYNIAKFLDKFTFDTNYLPILIYHIEYLEEKMEISLENNESFNAFSKLSLLHNLLIAQNTRVLFKFLDAFNEGWSDIKSTSYEYLWFRISLFDKSFHRLARQRENMLKSIRKSLHREIFIEEFVNEKNSSLKLINKANEDKYTIIFDNENSFVKLIVRCIKIACRYFKPYDKSTIERKYVLEDFSIVRIYSNNSNGHPLLLMSILVKIVHDFLQLFNIEFRHKADNQFNLQITRNFIRVFDYFIKLSFDDQSDSYHVSAFPKENVMEYMRTSLNYDNDDVISEFLEPISSKYMIEYFMKIDFLHTQSSSSRVENHRRMSIDENFDSTLNYLKRKVTMISPSEFEFIKYACANFIFNTSQKYDCSKFETLFNKFNNFIYFNSIMDLKFAKDPLMRYFDLDADVKYISTNFDLNNPDSKISFENIWQSLCYPLDTYKDGPISNLQIGSVVYHKKFKTYGIILSGFIGDFYSVFTTKKSLEVYNAKSIVPLQEIDTDRIKILMQVIYSCGIDIIGLLFFGKVSFDNNCVKLDLIK